jgi:S1-C subfamily serine protease
LPEGSFLIFNNELLKIYPKENDIKTGVSSGTGFAISSNGIIATNYHVIEGASSIKVRGINFDFDKFYNAKVLAVDTNNDVALIKIDDVNFSSLGTIPFTIKTNIVSAGENVFVLGYPLMATMGEEIKLTNGIISSKTGFKGDPTCYQISAPIQPGNSGGPLFDKNGNLIGIVNAKHTGAENVSYAIKSQYLINLLETVPNKPKLPSVNLLINKSLTQQVELAKKKVYIIEVE